jgi:hypothetical protein
MSYLRDNPVFRHVLLLEWSRPGWLAGALAWVSAHAGAVSDLEQVRV